MIQLFYSGVLLASLLCVAIYIFMWHKHCDVNFTIIFTLVPIACLGYLLLSLSRTMEEALNSTKVIYIGGCFLQLFMILNILSICKIEIGKYLRTILFIICTVLYMPILNIGYGTSVYKTTSFRIENGTGILTKEYGGWHTVIYLSFALFFISGIGVVIYSWMKNLKVSRRILSLLVLPYVICVFSFFLIKTSVDLVPLGYVIAQIIYLIIVYRVNLYDVSDTVIDSMVKEQGIGYLSFDFDNRYLGSNDVAVKIFPELETIAVDEMFGYNSEQRKIRHFIENFKADSEKNTFTYSAPSENGKEGKVYKVNVNYLYDSDRKRGYLVTFTDDTANHKYIKLLDNYNDDLRQKVEEATQHVIEMHDNLIMSLAMMVESRDNSTGGHIKRTSEVVRILIDEIKNERTVFLSDEFCRAMIKAAPMHDLGKIAVDDAILRKPGRFTPEEYEAMKKHAPEGAKVIHQILMKTDDVLFKQIAENVAHYHHEHWDGSGYPERLHGEQIPLEARIMAIADVYDALVSERSYKEAFTFEQADKIIMDGMGYHFDPSLRNAYLRARPRLERYYQAQREKSKSL